ncbi:MAG: NAD(P)H-hydrate dehydratase [Anaerolineales bacterium]
MLKVVTTDEMRRIEKAADAGGLSYDEMMANAGYSIAEEIIDRWPTVRDASVLILVGPGNNGGDGLVVGHHMHEAGARVHVYLSHPRSEKEDHNYARIKNSGIKIMLAGEDESGSLLRTEVNQADLIVDALLGTGIKLPLRGSVKEILSSVKGELTNLDRRPYVVAVDCPSGLDCDTGEIADESLVADLTVTLAAAKPGLFNFPGASSVGEVVVGSIGAIANLPELSEVQHLLPDADLIRSWLPERPENAHKGTFGRVVVNAGSLQYPGAAVLASLGAYRIGAGLVSVAVPALIQPFLVPGLPEATWIPLPHDQGVLAEPAVDKLLAELSGVAALLIGPGFGQSPATRSFLQQLLRKGQGGQSGQHDHVDAGENEKAAELPPCVIDADGLKLLSEIEGWHKLLQHTAILTPHPGEFAIMTGISIGEIQSSRTQRAKAFAAEWGHVVVLKGAYTVIGAPDGRMATIPFATSALATAGTGDVLAGVILGLRGQGVPAFESAVLGAYLHAQAGELAARELGTEVSVIAGDVADSLPLVLAELKA